MRVSSTSNVAAPSGHLLDQLGSFADRVSPVPLNEDPPCLRFSPREPGLLAEATSSLMLYTVVKGKNALQPGEVLVDYEVGGFSCLNWSPNVDRVLGVGSRSGMLHVTPTSRTALVRDRHVKSVAYGDTDLACGCASLKGEAGLVILDPQTESTRRLGLVSEGVVELAWLNESLLAVGTVGGRMKLMDSRGVTCVTDVMAHPWGAVCGVRLDPSRRYVATCSGQGRDAESGLVKVWDWRRCDAPLHQLRVGDAAQQIEWAPDREQALVCITGSDAVVRIYNVAERGVLRRGLARPVTSFAVGLDGVLAVSWQATGRVGITSLTPRTTPIALSALDEACVGGRMTALPADPMRVLAQRGYWLDAGVNAALCDGMEDNAGLRRMWKWAARGGARAEASYPPSSRAALAALCGWAGNGAVQAAVDKGEFARATAISLLGEKDVRKAVGILRMDKNYELAAVALAGWSARGKVGGAPDDVLVQVDDGSMWSEAAAGIEQSLPRASLLRVAFLYLIAQSRGDWPRVLDAVLADDALALSDRLAIAGMFASDELLGVFLRRASAQAVRAGRIEGVVVLGMGDGLFPLLRSFVTSTGDVQTAALLCALNEFRDPGIKSFCKRVWIDLYRDLLDRWGLWATRAKLDLHLSRSFTSEKPGMYAHCQHCGAAWAAAESARALQARQSSLSNQRPNLSTCPGCSRALPLCSVCLSQLSCANPFSAHEGRLDVGQWFCWCLGCGHGGHTACMNAWFDGGARVSCPVAGCECTLCVDASDPVL